MVSIPTLPKRLSKRFGEEQCQGMRGFVTFILVCLFATPAAASWPSEEHDIILKDFHFTVGESLPEVRMHVTTLGQPHRDAAGTIDNAVLILHSTNRSGGQFLVPEFSDELFGPGKPLDIRRYYLILPDNLGRGASSKPSDGLRMAFPHYDYDDMVTAQYRMLTEGLGVTRLELILGTSMGCMHAFVWGTTRPGFARRLAPLACNAVEIAGRNRLFRKMIIDAIKADPAWNAGNYMQQPQAGLRAARNIWMLASANPLALQSQYPTRVAVDEYFATADDARAKEDGDANDQLYVLDASRNYNPAPLLSRITVPVLWINSADDFVNPPELGIAEDLVKRMPHARFVLIPETVETKGHQTHTWAKFWASELAKLLAE